MLSAYYVSCIYSNALQKIFYHGSKHNEPDHRRLMEQSDLGPYCCKQMREQMTIIVMNDEKTAQLIVL